MDEPKFDKSLFDMAIMGLMRQKGPSAGEAGNIALISLIILLLVAGVVYFLISKNTSTTDMGAKIYQQTKNPVSGLPETNPFSKVNPFKGVYKNPFK